MSGKPLSTSAGDTAMNKMAASSPVAGVTATTGTQPMRRHGEEGRWSWLVPTLYIIFLLLPIYWLVNMSFKTNEEIVSGLTFYPHEPTLRNYAIIFTDPSWYKGYINSITYVVMNMVISVACALPAAYAFSRETLAANRTR